MGSLRHERVLWFLLLLTLGLAAARCTTTPHDEAPAPATE